MESIEDPNDARQQERVEVEIPVELGYGDFEDSFEASALNLSRGGLSMSSPCLPDVGARLLCRFECGNSGATITAQGEVVWAQLDDGRRGEFGLCFVDVDPETEFLIEEMIAEQGAHVPAGQEPMEVVAPVAKLELEGSPEPIAARLAQSERGRAVFEQELDLLALGRAVYARELAEGEKRGSISGVELRMMGNVPTLAVTVAFEGAPSFGEFEWDGHSDDAEEVHDTEPDLTAPAAEQGQAQQARPAGFSRTTVNEYEAGGQRAEEAAPTPAVGEGWSFSSSLGGAEAAVDTSQPDATEELAAVMTRQPTAEPELDAFLDEQETLAGAEAEAALEAALGHAPSRAREAEPEHRSQSVEEPAPDVPRQVELALPSSPGAVEARPMQRPSSSGEEEAMPAALGDIEDAPELADDAEPEPQYEDADDAFAPPTAAMRARRMAVATWARAVAAGAAVLAALTPLVGRAMPQLRGLWVKLRGGTRGALRKHVAPTVGAARRLVGGKLARKRRRTAGVPAAGKRKANGALRTVGLGLLGAAAVGLGVYALAPEQAEDGLDLHREVKAPEAGRAAAALPSAKAKPKATATAAGQPQAEPVPSAKEVPAASPFAVDVREGGKVLKVKPAAAARSKAEFGAAEVEGGRTFKLRMSAPVRKLEGIPDKGGFTVVIPGSLSLDRAGPIAAAHRAVRRSMILNKGTRAELTIRFAEGKRPDYRVRGEGQMLHITIGN